MTTLEPLEGGTLRIFVEVAPPALLIRLEGELDFACAELLEAITGVELTTVDTVTVDLDGLTFCDSVGLEALITFRSAHVASDRQVRLLNASPLLRRLFALAGEELELAA